VPERIYRYACISIGNLGKNLHFRLQIQCFEACGTLKSAFDKSIDYCWYAMMTLLHIHDEKSSI